MNSSATPTAVDRAGGRCAPSDPPAHPPSCWASDLIARREAARRFLGAAGATPYLMNRDAQVPINAWYVSGWSGIFSDHELIHLAEQMGMEAAHG